MPVRMQRWEFSNPAAPVAIRDSEPDRPGQRLLPAIFEDVAGEARPVLDWRRVQGLVARARDLPGEFFLAPDAAAFQAALSAPERVLLGEAQERWFDEQLRASVTAGRAWQIVGNQVLMAPIAVPDLSRTPAALAAALERLQPGVSQLLKLSRFPFPLSTDSWDGYPAARARVLKAMREAGGNTIVVTGDSHIGWANELHDSEGRVGVEFGATSITSPSESSYFTGAGVDFPGAVRARNPHVKWLDGDHRGFLVLTLTREAASAEFVKVSNILSPDYEVSRAGAFSVAPAPGAGIGAISQAD
jgi:alkaline phosphatase D